MLGSNALSAGAGTNSSSPVAAVSRSFKFAVLALGLFSGAINLLMLTGALFMLQVYDRVLPSGSIPTLIALIIITTLMYLFQGILEWIRGRLLVRIAGTLDAELNPECFQASMKLSLMDGKDVEPLQPLRDIDQVRSFLAGPGPTALFDLPWMPLYLAICFLFHFWIGIAALLGALILITLTLITEFYSRSHAAEAVKFGTQRARLAEAAKRNADTLRAMGMSQRFNELWRLQNHRYLQSQTSASDIVGGLSSTSRVTRLMLQSAVLAVGAFLVIQGQATAGIIIASSILTSRALAPVELAIANWKGFVSARNSWGRLGLILTRLKEIPKEVQLPKPEKFLAVEGVTAGPSGSEQRAIVHDVSFRVDAGQALGVIGPSASGKSSLSRAIVGIWPTLRGRVRIDGAAIDHWDAGKLGDHIGYLSQVVELFEGTVGQNISRFEPQPDSAKIIRAAQDAGVHELILRLPGGYETQVGDRGVALSAGQRQRIALARALYGEPFLVVLDEPNSNLDADGDQALSEAIARIKSRGGVVVLVAHRPAALANVDLVLAMANGRAQAFGPKDKVLQDILRPNTQRLNTVRPKGDV